MAQPDKESIDKWHRWFAVECNNRAWDLAAAGARTPDETREMVSAAYAAAFHWSRVGAPINDARAVALLARVHSLTGEGAKAMAYARQYLEFCENNDCEDWDLAFAHAEIAMAAYSRDDRETYIQHYARARELGGTIQQREEREVFLTEFARIPAP